MAQKSKVRIYTTSTCPWRVKTKEFLKANNTKYNEDLMTKVENKKRE